MPLAKTKHVSCLFSNAHCQGVGEIIRSSETIFGDTGDVPQVEDEVERDTFDLTIDFMEARMLNKSAGQACVRE